MKISNKKFDFKKAYKILLSGLLGGLTVAACTVIFSPIAAVSILLTLPVGAFIGGGIIFGKIVKQKRDDEKLKESENKMVIDVLSPKTENGKDLVVDVESVISNSPSYQSVKDDEIIEMEM